MLALLTSAALLGIEAEAVQVEVNANEQGEPKLVLVGLPDAAVKESDDRVSSALANCGFEPLRARATINLAPGHLRKEGPLYDLPIALGILAATGQLASDRLGDCLFAGERSLSGATRPIRGGLAMARPSRAPSSANGRCSCSGQIPPRKPRWPGRSRSNRVDSLGEACRFLKPETSFRRSAHVPALAWPPAGGGSRRILLADFASRTSRDTGRARGARSRWR